jgi:1-pyrroline-5-carboxylate dehydrogenase
MRLLEAAGLSAGVINMVTGDGLAVSRVALTDPDLAGLHFTGSSATFKTLCGRSRTTSTASAATRGSSGRPAARTSSSSPLGRPRAADHRARPRRVRVPGPEVLGRVPRLRPPQHLERGAARGAGRRHPVPRYADVAALTNFGGAVIDARAFDRHRRALDRAKQVASLEILAGGGTDDSEGFFVDPIVLVGTDLADEAFTTEYFGPILAVHVYDDAAYGDTLALVDRTSGRRARTTRPARC